MARNDQAVVSMRCPVCFGREIDVLLLHNGREYYCVKCSYRGTEDEVRAVYDALKQKYENRTRRLDIDAISRL